MPYQFKKFSGNQWKRLCAKYIVEQFTSLKSQDRCNIIITSGDSAELIYNEISQLNQFFNLSNINFYLSDERFSPGNDRFSNYKRIMLSLFKNGIPTGCNFIPAISADQNLAEATSSYNSILPECIDISILSLASDGHIASLFSSNDDNRYLNRNNKVIQTFCSTIPRKRISISSKVINASLKNYIFCFGPEKYKILQKIINSEKDLLTSPVHLIKNAKWLLS